MKEKEKKEEEMQRLLVSKSKDINSLDARIIRLEKQIALSKEELSEKNKEASAKHDEYEGKNKKLYGELCDKKCELESAFIQIKKLKNELIEKHGLYEQKKEQLTQMKAMYELSAEANNRLEKESQSLEN